MITMIVWLEKIVTKCVASVYELLTEVGDELLMEVGEDKNMTLRNAESCILGDFQGRRHA